MRVTQRGINPPQSLIVGFASFLVINGQVSAGLAGLCLVYSLDVTKVKAVQVEHVRLTLG